VRWRYVASFCISLHCEFSTSLLSLTRGAARRRECSAMTQEWEGCSVVRLRFSSRCRSPPTGEVLSLLTWLVCVGGSPQSCPNRIHSTTPLNHVPCTTAPRTCLVLLSSDPQTRIIARASTSPLPRLRSRRPLHLPSSAGSALEFKLRSPLSGKNECSEKCLGMRFRATGS